MVFPYYRGIGPCTTILTKHRKIQTSTLDKMSTIVVLIGRVVPQEEQDGGFSSQDVTGDRVEQQCRTDLCVPKYARGSFNLTTSSVQSGFLVDGSSGESTEEGLVLGAAGGRAKEGMGCAGVGCGRHGVGRVVPQEKQDGGCSSLDVTGDRVCLSSNAALTLACRNMHATALTYYVITTSVESGFLVRGSS